MDIVTHALSGSLVALALPQRPKPAFFVPFFALVACLPDLDIVFASTPALFLSLHRGISHSLFAAPLLAFVAALVPWIFRRTETRKSFSFAALWLACLACLLIHIGLDCITTFGTMIFLPFSSERVRLNATFIVDLFLSLPLLILFVAGLVRQQKRMVLACAGLVWMLVYPSVCLGFSALAKNGLTSHLEQQGRTISSMVLLPDFFTPLYWRALFLEQEEDGRYLEHELSISGLGTPRGPAIAHTPLSENRARRMAARSERARDFLDLMLLPVVRPLSQRHREAALVALSFLPRDGSEDETATGKGKNGGHAIRPLDEETVNSLKFLLVYDLRFGSGLALGRELLSKRPKANIPFRLMVVLDKDDNILLERVVFSDARKDSGWTRPQPPRPQTFGQWLLGIH